MIAFMLQVKYKENDTRFFKTYIKKVKIHLPFFNLVYITKKEISTQKDRNRVDFKFILKSD